MTSLSNTSTLKIIRQLLSEVRRSSSEKKLRHSVLAQYILAECRKHQTTDLQTCKAQEEVKYLAHTYLCYLTSKRNYEKINSDYSGKGERTVAETANLVGFKLPHDPK